MGRIGRIERMIKALRDGDITYLDGWKGYAEIKEEISDLMSNGGHIDDLLYAIADLIEEGLGE